MNKYIQTLTNSRGDVLPGDRLQVVTSAGALVNIYADDSGTNFTDEDENVVNYATADLNGLVEFYWTPAAGQVLQWLDTNGDLRKAITDFAKPFLLDNVVGDLPQSRVTDLVTDLAAQQTELDQRNPLIADYTGATDIAADLQAKIDASYTDYNRTVKLRNGAYSVSTGIAIEQGVMIEGEGSQGSHYDYGTAILHGSTTGAALKWDGSSGLRAGTGGGLKNVTLYKESGLDGGNAIEIEAQDDDHRPGEMIFENVAVLPNSGNFDRCLVVDGTAANTPGTRGVRHLHFVKFRAASSNVDNESVVLNQVTHFFGHGFAMDQGSGAGVPGMTIMGVCDSVFFPSLDFAGNVIITADSGRDTDGEIIETTTTALDNFHVTGKANLFINNDKWVSGTALLSFGVSSSDVITNKSKYLKIISHLAPDIALYKSSTTANFAGDGSSYTLVFDTEERDRGNNISTGPWSSFTCKCAGTYEVIVTITINNISSTHDIGQANLVVAQAAGGTRSYTTTFNPYGLRSGAGQATVQIIRMVALEYDDVISATLLVSGSGGGTAKTVGLVGASARQTSFSVKYLP